MTTRKYNSIEYMLNVDTFFELISVKNIKMEEAETEERGEKEKGNLSKKETLKCPQINGAFS